MSDPPDLLLVGGPAAAPPELAPPRCRTDAPMKGHHQHHPIPAIGDRRWHRRCCQNKPIDRCMGLLRRRHAAAAKLRDGQLL
jgi:hypothetical protein